MVLRRRVTRKKVSRLTHTVCNRGSRRDEEEKLFNYLGKRSRRC